MCWQEHGVVVCRELGRRSLRVYLSYDTRALAACKTLACHCQAMCLEFLLS